MNEATEFEIMRTLHTFFVKDLMSWEMVEEYLIASTQLEITFMNEDRIEAESLDGKTKYEIGGK
jgi:beta-xylosidase